MKSPTLSILLVAFLGMLPAKAAEASRDWVENYDELLGKYVTEKGVCYQAWHENAADRAKLKGVVEAIAEAPVPEGRDAALAHYLNAYNAWVLHNILKKYPTKGPLDGETLFFHGRRIRLAGKKMSLDTLEQKIIRPTFSEPRVHFALNCAAVSCPPLASHAFRPETLDEDLEKLTRDFTAKASAAEWDAERGVLRVSKIFDWYKEDFQAAGGVVPFINKYGSRKFNPKAKFEPMEYDWALNDAQAHCR